MFGHSGTIGAHDLTQAAHAYLLDGERVVLGKILPACFVETTTHYCFSTQCVESGKGKGLEAFATGFFGEPGW